MAGASAAPPAAVFRKSRRVGRFIFISRGALPLGLPGTLTRVVDPTNMAGADLFYTDGGRSSMPMYLGFDASTQSLTATVIDTDRRAIVFEEAIAFDEAFPEYGTAHGVTRAADGLTVTTPPALWVAALDRMAGMLSTSGLDLSRIEAISGSG